MSNITNLCQLNPVWYMMLYSCTQYPYGSSGRQRVNQHQHSSLPASVPTF